MFTIFVANFMTNKLNSEFCNKKTKTYTELVSIRHLPLFDTRSHMVYSVLRPSYNIESVWVKAFQN